MSSFVCYAPTQIELFFNEEGRVFLSYFLGSIPFGLILTKRFGLGDIRTIGSGNIGATNVLRTGNKKLALATLILDASKPLLCLLLLYLLFGFKFPLGHFNTVCSYPFQGMCDCEYAYFKDPNETKIMLTVLFAVLGHCFPIWLKFKGGKGVATALGGLLAAVPYVGLAACAAWIIAAKVTKISSLSALVALAVAPIVTFFIYGSAPAVICTLITLLVWWRHKDNIKRLLNGTEPKIGQKKKDTDAPPVSE